ncbi:MAG: hypothetical protein HYV26_14810 [Candidatus Hydrogenedentes bacterium]|nr:hypothetical protein [Candidatus Hydrogenedentota bacterium]
MKRTIDTYLKKRAQLTRWLLESPRGEPMGAVHQGDPGPFPEAVVVIPCLAEHETLFETLERLGENPPELLRRTLVICVVNNRVAPHGREEDIANNQACLARLRHEFAAGLPQLCWVDASSSGRELPANAGVGLARKIGLDHGLARLHAAGRDEAPLVCLDADTHVEPTYLPALFQFYKARGRWAGVLSYAHRLEGPEKQQAAILAYERFLRYHEAGLRFAGSPYAFHTIGSTISCTAAAYAAVSGMNQRQAGEDFYFLQQLAKTGVVEQISGTVVHPSSRPSHRVPFGTGRRVYESIEAGKPAQTTYNPRSYRILREWLALVSTRHEAGAAALLAAAREIDAPLAEFLCGRGFEETWARLQREARTPEQLLAQFHRWFDAFKTLKLLHFLRDTAYPDVALEEAWKQRKNFDGEDERIAETVPLC